jgi:hypothetical protein
MAALAFAFVLALAASALAQQAQFQITQGPYYAGVPIDMQVVADNFDDEPQPDVKADAPAGTTLSFVQARPQVSSMMQIVNGHVTQSRTVRFGFVYQLTAPAAGHYTVGPFTVTQEGGKSAVTRSLSINVIDVPEASGQKLRVVLPDHAIFIGQRIPVRVEWWTEEGLADRLFNEHLNAPLFLDTTHFQFIDEPHAPTRLSISVDVPGGNTEFPVEVKETNDGGKRYVVRTFTRMMVPVATGHFDLGEPSLFCEEAVSFQRDLFGSRVPSQARKLRVAGAPMGLDVQAVPVAGRPASFAGAIGQNFSISVAADRTVLQAGDPVKLSITVHGDGTLDTATLPPLAAAGLSDKQFRVPDNAVAGLTDETGKHFEVSVRVLDASVREIPPVSYSWFDPATGRFETTHSPPIALSVRPSTVVGANDVVSAAPAEKHEEEPKGAAQPGAAGPAGATGSAAARTPSFTLTGADLSIVTDTARLRSMQPSVLASSTVQWSAYATGLAALLAGFAVRRRRSVDPVKARLRKDLRALRRRVSSSRSAREVADCLRKMASLLVDSASHTARLDGVLAGLDEVAFAPGGEAAITIPLRNESVAVADAMLESLQ